jgi:hypothetical protein
MMRFEHAIHAEQLVWRARNYVRDWSPGGGKYEGGEPVDMALPLFWVEAAKVHAALAAAPERVAAEVEQHAVDAARAAEAAAQGSQPGRAARAVNRELSKLPTVLTAEQSADAARPRPGPPPTCLHCGRASATCTVVPCAGARQGDPE